METLYAQIEKLCNKNGIRPGKMCADLGLSRSLITDLKMGRKKSISTETAQKIATYFGISVSALLNSEIPSPKAAGDTILEEVDVAFYGQYKELTAEDKETVRDMVHLLRQRRAAKQRD